MKKKFGLPLLIIGCLAGIWLLTTAYVPVWSARNTLKYHLLQGWWSLVGSPQVADMGLLQGIIRNQQGEPLPHGWVLVTLWDGTTFSSRSDAQGHYQFAVPEGNHQAIAAAPGYLDKRVDRVTITPHTTTTLSITLTAEQPTIIKPGQKLALSEPTTLSCTTPFTATAARQVLTFEVDGIANDLTFYYRPITTTARLPLLLTVYPGPVDAWECVSIGLSDAGYAVVAVGPAYSFDVEAQLDELERLLNFAQQEQLPGVDGRRIALLGGSFSSIHVQRLLQRRQDVQAALLLGPPTDMFDMRHRLESRTYIPPFGLDQIMVAAGLPTDELPLYWHYSAAYHVRPDFPPQALLHSRTDEVVPIEQSERLADNLRAVGAPYETHFFDGASHYLMAPGGDATQVFEVTLDFLARHLR